ncbi:MAG TPA: tyrosine-type recombinase/integrase [Spirochaetota bacterium]|nr:tyrosine-type recombinase/integrase [Spirochaetota bacterium]HOM37765.1 tyrosine-type recombinase/integrase [Spirochaetota bacterium]HPQ49358.1 tyrosine-type recombinase/integrase [Spirochaetota bacterium]
MIEFIDYLKSKGFSENTIKSYLNDINIYVRFCNKMGFDIYNKESIYKFFSYLKTKKMEDTSIKRKKASLIVFSNFLKVIGKELIFNKNDINVRPKKRLPSYIKTERIREILNILNVSDELEYRDFFIIFFLFSTGVRVSELVNIKTSDINIKERSVIIRGKGNKERIVVFPETLTLEYEDYYNRFKHIIDKIGYIFFNNRGKKITRRGIEFILEKIHRKKYYFLSGQKKLHPHLLRHSYATALIENGADIKTIATLMGHSSLDTTSKYTHLSTKKLKEVYQLSHPHA